VHDRSRHGVRWYTVIRFLTALEATSTSLQTSWRPRAPTEGSTIPSKARGTARV
jgi:hypothetical protein